MIRRQFVVVGESDLYASAEMLMFEQKKKRIYSKYHLKESRCSGADYKASGLSRMKPAELKSCFAKIPTCTSVSLEFLHRCEAVTRSENQ